MNNYFLIICFSLIYAFSPYVVYGATNPIANVYCTNSSPKIAFYFPGHPIVAKPKTGESYWYSDQVNKNSYQFNYDNLGELLKQNKMSPEDYIDVVFTARCKGTGSKIIDKKVIKEGNKTTAIFVTGSVTPDGVNKTSYHKYVIAGSVYYNWSVHSYDGVSKLTAKFLFNKYSKLLEINSQYCN